MSRTPYVETEILLAVMEGNTSRAQDFIEGMLNGELRVFRNQVRELLDLLEEAH